MLGVTVLCVYRKQVHVFFYVALKWTAAVKGHWLIRCVPAVALRWEAVICVWGKDNGWKGGCYVKYKATVTVLQRLDWATSSPPHSIKNTSGKELTKWLQLVWFEMPGNFRFTPSQHFVAASHKCFNQTLTIYLRIFFTLLNTLYLEDLSFSVCL